MIKYLVIISSIICLFIGFFIGKYIYEGNGQGKIITKIISIPKYETKFVPVSTKDYVDCYKSKINISYTINGSVLTIRAEDKCKSTTLSLDQRIECPKSKINFISAGVGAVVGFLTAVIFL